MPGFTDLCKDSREIVKTALNSIFRGGYWERPATLSPEVIRAAKFIEQNYTVERNGLIATFGSQISPFLATRQKSQAQSTESSANNVNNDSGNNNTNGINNSNNAPAALANNRVDDFVALQNPRADFINITCSISIPLQQHRRPLQQENFEGTGLIEQTNKMPGSNYGNVSVMAAPRGAPPEHFPEFGNLSPEARNLVKIRLEALRDKRRGAKLSAETRAHVTNTEKEAVLFILNNYQYSIADLANASGLSVPSIHTYRREANISTPTEKSSKIIIPDFSQIDPAIQDEIKKAYSILLNGETPIYKAMSDLTDQDISAIKYLLDHSELTPAQIAEGTGFYIDVIFQIDRGENPTPTRKSVDEG